MRAAIDRTGASRMKSMPARSRIRPFGLAVAVYGAWDWSVLVEQEEERRRKMILEKLQLLQNS